MDFMRSEEIKGQTLTMMAFDELNKEENVGFFKSENDDAKVVAIAGGFVGFGLAVMQLIEAVALTFIAAFLIIADLITKAEYKAPEVRDIGSLRDAAEVVIHAFTEEGTRAEKPLQLPGFQQNLEALNNRLALSWASVFTIAKYPASYTA